MKGGGLRVEISLIAQLLALKRDSAPTFRLKFESNSQPFSEIRKEFMMKMIMRDIRIDVAVDKVFDFLVDPHHLPEIWPNIVEVDKVKKAKNGDGFTFEWDYKMAGEQFEGKCETIEQVPNERLVVKSNKGLDSTLTWRFQPGSQQTHVTLKFEYQIPASLTKKMKEEIIHQENEHELVAMLQNLKTRLELETVYA